MYNAIQTIGGEAVDEGRILVLQTNAIWLVLFIAIAVTPLAAAEASIGIVP